MKIETSITNITSEGKEIIHGKALEELVATQSFSAAVYFLLTGKQLEAAEEKMLDAILVSVIDHGPGTASAMSARISASAKNPTHASLAAGILSLGDRHGLAVTGAMEFLYDAKDESDIDELVKTLKEGKIRIPGFGHKLFTDEDPRATTLFKMAREQGVAGAYIELAQTVHASLNALSSKQLPINVDGAIAAILCDMGIEPQLGNALFLIGRVPGLLAQILEEQAQDVGIRRLSLDEIEYQGE